MSDHAPTVLSADDISTLVDIATNLSKMGSHRGSLLVRLLRDYQSLLARVIATAEVGCVKTWGRTQMKCFPSDPCSFCRARKVLQP